jgi:hypothetical protein
VWIVDEFAGTEDDLGGTAVTFRWVDRGMVGMVGRRARDWLGGQVGMDAEKLTLAMLLCSAR